MYSDGLCVVISHYLERLLVRDGWVDGGDETYKDRVVVLVRGLGLRGLCGGLWALGWTWCVFRFVVGGV